MYMTSEGLGMYPEPKFRFFGNGLIKDLLMFLPILFTIFDDFSKWNALNALLIFEYSTNMANFLKNF